MPGWKFLLVGAAIGTTIHQSVVGREWTDVSNRFKTEAEFVVLSAGHVQLRKPDGTVIKVPLSKLSEADRHFAREASAQQDRGNQDELSATGVKPTVPSAGSASRQKAADGFLTPGTVVAPGKNTLSKALRSAEDCDRLILQPGIYIEDNVFEFPKMVLVVGDLNSGTIVRHVGMVAMRKPLVLRSIRFAVNGEDAQNVSTIISVPARIERCRFDDFSIALVLKKAPLCDVVQCDFSGCRMGVWINDGSSPTAWGCRFQDCGTGIGGREGTPYLADNLFVATKHAVSLELVEATIVRNNVFVNSGARLQSPAGADENVRAIIFNNVFHDCSPLEIGRAWISHNVFFPARDNRWVSDSAVVTEQESFNFDPGYKQPSAGDVRTKDPRRLRGRGFTPSSTFFRRQEELPKTIGLTDPKSITGWQSPTTLHVPYRWSEPFLINGLREAELVVSSYFPERKIEHINRTLNECRDKWILDQGSVEFDTVRFFPALMFK